MEQVIALKMIVEKYRVKGWKLRADSTGNEKVCDRVSGICYKDIMAWKE